MKLDKYQKVEETDSHFVLHDGEGQFRVPKAHLHHSTVEKIRQHFSDGGEVQPELSADDRAAFDMLGVPPPKPKFDGRAVVGDDARAFLATPDAPPPGPLAQPPTDPVSLPSRQEFVGPPAPVQQQTAPSPTAGVDAGVRMETQGAQQGAASRERWGNEAASMEQENARQMQAMAQKHQQVLSDRMAQGQALADSVLNGKMDPNHFWETRSTGEKIGSAIALVLGGMGASLTRGPNYAMQVIDKAIDRDIEAQKINIDQGRNKLAFYLKQTGELQSAMQLEKADALTVAAAKMQSVASSAGASAAGPQAMEHIGAMQVQAAQLRQEATMKQMQIESTQMGMQYQRAQMGLLTDVMGQIGKGHGVTIQPGQEMLLPKEMQETLIRLPNGKVDWTRTPKDAEDVRKTQESTSILRQKLQRYGALQQAHPNGISRVLSPEDYNAAKSLHDSILTDLNGLAGLNRFTHEEAQIFSQRVPDITEVQRSSASGSKLNELGNEIDDKITSANKTYLRFSGGAR